MTYAASYNFSVLYVAKATVITIIMTYFIRL
jgi:hypothetical protein